MLLNAAQIRELAETYGMIEPFFPQKVQVAHLPSYGLDPFGYTFRLANRLHIVSAIPTLSGGGLLLKWDGVTESCVEQAEGTVVKIPPFSFVLCCSVEYFRLPSHVTGLLVGKSTYTRQGICYLMTVVDAGYEGNLTFGLANLGNKEVGLVLGGGIGQILFATGDPSGVVYEGRYQNSVGITPARLELRD